jgi:L-aspartate oxidase
MAGNSLAEAVVFGRRAAVAIAAAGHRAGDPEWKAPPRPVEPVGDVWAEVVQAVSRGAGPIRDGVRSTEALTDLDAILEEAAEGSAARSMALAGRLLVRGALAREETRGTHVRSDHPGADPALAGIHLSVSR